MIPFCVESMLPLGKQQEPVETVEVSRLPGPDHPHDLYRKVLLVEAGQGSGHFGRFATPGTAAVEPHAGEKRLLGLRSGFLVQ